MPKNNKTHEAISLKENTLPLSPCPPLLPFLPQAFLPQLGRNHYPCVPDFVPGPLYLRITEDRRVEHPPKDNEALPLTSTPPSASFPAPRSDLQYWVLDLVPCPPLPPPWTPDGHPPAPFLVASP